MSPSDNNRHFPRSASPVDVTEDWDNDDRFNYATSLKGVFCGSGSDMMNDIRPIKVILDMVNKPVEQVNVGMYNSITVFVVSIERTSAHIYSFYL